MVAPAFDSGMMRRSAAMTLERYLEEELLNVALNGHGPDAAEGRASFLEKRRPQFRGSQAPGPDPSGAGLALPREQPERPVVPLGYAPEARIPPNRYTSDGRRQTAEGRLTVRRFTI